MKRPFNKIKIVLNQVIMIIIKPKTKLAAMLMALIILASSCASTTLINSIPSGADLYLDGKAVGQTPYEMRDTKPMFSTTTVRIEKENYETYYNSITRDEEVDAGAIVGGILFWFPFIWALKYQPTHIFRLTPLEKKADTFEQLIEKQQKD